MILTVKSAADRKAMNFAMNLSLAVGVLMLVMKVGAYLLTGSAAIFHSNASWSSVSAVPSGATVAAKPTVTMAITST